MTSRSEDAGTDLARLEHPTTPTRQLVIPFSGEVISLDAPTEVLASLVAGIRETESELRELKSTLSIEVHRRMDEEARWTVVAGQWKVVGSSPSRVSYDAEELDQVLKDLVEAGRISQRAADTALERVTTLRVRTSGVLALKRLGGEVEAAVAATEIPVDPDSRRLTVTFQR